MSKNAPTHSAAGPDEIMDARMAEVTEHPRKTLALEDLEQMNATVRLERKVERLCDGVEEGVEGWAKGVRDLKDLSVQKDFSTLLDEWLDAIGEILPDTERTSYEKARSLLSPLMEHVVQETASVESPLGNDAYQLGRRLKNLLKTTVIPASDLRSTAKMTSITTLAILASRRLPKVLSNTGDTKQLSDHLERNGVFTRMDTLGLRMKVIHEGMRKASNDMKNALVSIHAFPTSIREDDLRPFLGTHNKLGKELTAHAKKVLKERSKLDAVPSRRLGSSDLLWMPNHFSLSKNKMYDRARLPHAFNDLKEVGTKEDCKKKTWSHLLEERGTILYHVDGWEREVNEKISAMKER